MGRGGGRIDVVQDGHGQHGPLLEACVKDGPQNRGAYSAASTAPSHPPRPIEDGKDRDKTVVKVEDDAPGVWIDRHQWAAFTERPQDVPLVLERSGGMRPYVVWWEVRVVPDHRVLVLVGGEEEESRRMGVQVDGVQGCDPAVDGGTQHDGEGGGGAAAAAAAAATARPSPRLLCPAAVPPRSAQLSDLDVAGFRNHHVLSHERKRNKVTTGGISHLSGSTEAPSQTHVTSIV